MILMDMSGILHRMVYGASKVQGVRIKDGKYVTADYEAHFLDLFFSGTN